MKSFCIEVVPPYHFGFIGRLLGLDQDTGKAFWVGRIMNYKISAVFRVNIKLRMIEGVLKKIAQVILDMFLRFRFVQPIQKRDQVFLEQLNITSGRLNLEVGFV